jgi:site-specific recombinase XerD
MAATERMVDAAKARLESSGISQRNKQLVLEYDKKLSSDVGFARRKKIIDYLKWWAQELKADFDKAGKEELDAVYTSLKADRARSTGTKNNHIFILRQFYKHLEGDDDFFPEKIRKLKPMAAQQDMISEDGTTSVRIFTTDEIESMINSGRTARDKCLIALSYDSGGRLDEISALKMMHVKQDGMFYKIFLHGDKTKNHNRVAQRWVSVYYSVPYIREYVRTHPHKYEGGVESFWTSFDVLQGNMGKPLTYDGVRKIFERAMEVAGIEGRRFHDLRHTKYTHLCRMGMKEQQAKKFMGWSLNSKQPARYAHLVDEDISEELARMYGLPFERKKKDTIPIPIRCPKCSEVNDAGSEVCSKCSNPLSLKAIHGEVAREGYLKKKLSELEKREQKREKLLESMNKQIAALTARQAVQKSEKEFGKNG